MGRLRELLRCRQCAGDNAIEKRKNNVEKIVKLDRFLKNCSIFTGKNEIKLFEYKHNIFDL